MGGVPFERGYGALERGVGGCGVRARAGPHGCGVPSRVTARISAVDENGTSRVVPPVGWLLVIALILGGSAGLGTVRVGRHAARHVWPVTTDYLWPLLAMLWAYFLVSAAVLLAIVYTLISASKS